MIVPPEIQAVIASESEGCIVHGDCLEILPRLSARCAGAVITDPPYDLGVAAKSIIHKELLRMSCGVVIVFCPPENQWILPADQYLFWTKPVSTKNTSKRYSRFVEMILVYGTGVWDTSSHWSNYTNIFGDLVDDARLHPARKPPSLLLRLLRNHTKKGDIVLDPFCGSGTTCIAAKELGRRWIGIEKDEACVKYANDELSTQETKP